jgi:hypothetical protein
MTDAYASWEREPARWPITDRGPRAARTALFAIIGLSLVGWLPLAIPLVLLLRH